MPSESEQPVSPVARIAAAGLVDLFRRDRALADAADGAARRVEAATERRAARDERTAADLRRAFNEHRALTEERRELAVDIGETTSRMVASLLESGLDDDAVRQVDVVALAEGTLRLAGR